MMTLRIYMVIVLTMSLTVGISQESMGLVPDNYHPLQGAKLNPSAIVDQKPWLSVQLIGLHGYARNNAAFFQQSTYFNRANEVSFHESRSKYSGYSDIEIDGIGASLSLGEYAIAIHSGARALVNAKGIPGELANVINDETYSPADGTYNSNFARAKGMAWGQVGATVGKVLFNKGEHFFTGAVTVNRLFGFGNANLIINNANVSIVNGDATLNNLHGKYSFSNFALNAGKGWSTSIGVTYKKMKDEMSYYTPHSTLYNCETINYRYKIGLSLIDLGYINFNNQARTASFNEEMTIEELEAIYEEGNDATLNPETSFNATLPTALSGQFDYNVNDYIYLNASIIQKITVPSFIGSERDNLLAVSARYESKWLGIGIPVTLQNYKHPQVGLALRMGPLSIGTDHILPLFIPTDIYAADVYAVLRFNIMKSPGCREPKIKKSKTPRSKKVYCPAWK